jgi:hypothetical protein
MSLTGYARQQPRHPPWLLPQGKPQPLFALAFAASQLALVISTKPWPLQEFMPLQEFLADLQEDCPLQEFTPVHLIFASSALAVEAARVPNSSAAAVAIATPPAFDVFMFRLH